MEPRIQYAKTADGVSIAFWTLGEGPLYVSMPGGPVSNIQMEWQIPEIRAIFEAWAAGRKLVRFDRRGCGLSERSVTDYRLDALLLDLEAVVDRLAPEKLAVHGTLLAGPLAIAYAARHPDGVSHLILANSYARGADIWRMPRLRALRALGEADWDTYLEALAHMYFPDPATGAAFMRENATSEAQKAFIDATAEHDVTGLLAEVRCPALVLYAPGDRPFLLDVGMNTVRALVSGIPGASLVVTESTEATLQAIEEFLGEGEEAAPTAETQPPGAFRTVLFTDVEGSTAMTQRLGDAKGRDVLREHERITREVLKAHGGAEVKTMGDGFMASFSSVTRAVECAIALQRALAERNESTGEPLDIRVGLNAGEPIEEEGDLFGAMVILAARIAAKAQGGEILASLAVRELCAGKGFLFADTGDVTLKGFEEPVRLYEVGWRD
jgi:class 3 adenylate cyclase